MAELSLYVNEVVSSGAWLSTGTTPWLNAVDGSYVYSIGRKLMKSLGGES